VAQGLLADTLFLEVVPHELVRVQLWRIAWKKVKLEISAEIPYIF
jgi:hypothetical protein